MKGLKPLQAAVLGLLIMFSQFALAADVEVQPQPMLEVEQVDINRADAQTLARLLDGVGLVKAEAIVQYREEVGSFASAEELSMVNGIGEMTVQRNLDRIRVE